jgi:hypothetical protein
MQVIALVPTKFIGGIKSCGLTLGFPLWSPRIFFTQNLKIFKNPEPEVLLSLKTKKTQNPRFLTKLKNC